MSNTLTPKQALVLLAIHRLQPTTIRAVARFLGKPRGTVAGYLYGYDGWRGLIERGFVPHLNGRKCRLGLTEAGARAIEGLEMMRGEDGKWWVGRVDRTLAGVVVLGVE